MVAPAAAHQEDNQASSVGLSLPASESGTDRCTLPNATTGQEHQGLPIKRAENPGDSRRGVNGQRGALPFKDIGREGLSTDVRHRVLLNAKIVLFQPLGRCRRSSFIAAAAHLGKANVCFQRTRDTPCLLSHRQLQQSHEVKPSHPEARPAGCPDLPPTPTPAGLDESPWGSAPHNLRLCDTRSKIKNETKPKPRLRPQRNYPGESPRI